MTDAAHRRIPIPLLLGVLALGVLDVASGDSAEPMAATPAEPTVIIDTPDAQPVLVRDASFMIAGTFGGHVNTVEVAIDSVDLGGALRGEAGGWRVPADRVSVTPGLHEITATAMGEGGTDTDQLWVFYEPNPAATFRLVLMPETATYGPTESADDPRLLSFGPGFGDNFTVELSVTAPSQLSVSTNTAISTGSSADVTVDVIDPTPGVYPIVVRGVGPNGDPQEVTHTITVTGPAPTSSTASGPEPVAILGDDFEGPNLWTTAVTASTNGSAAAVELSDGGGNPGGFRAMTHALPGTDDGDSNPTQITVLHLYDGGEWNPAIDGALSHINYSEDQIELEPPFAGAAIGAVFVVSQGGTDYIAFTNPDNAFSNTAWQTVRVTNLTPTDFLPAPGPDFSAAGAPMMFGYQRSNTSRSSGGITTQHGIDNWTVELFGR